MKTNLKRSLMALVIATTLSLPTFAAGEPGNVSNVKVTAKDATTLTVTWDAVKDAEGNPVDHYKLYYGSESVQKSQAAQYEVEVETPDSTPSYDITDLNTDTVYYVSVTAIDKEDLESVEYSVEASGQPGLEGVSMTNTDDKVAPTVLNVIAADKTHVLVRFSEKVTLPAVIPEAAFVITEQAAPDKMLEVVSAKMYADDAEGKTVILETVNQTPSVNYLMTASAAIKDEAGNPIQSGNTDSGVFMGSNTAKSTVVTSPKNDTLKPAADETTPAPTAEDLLKDSTTPTSNTNTTPAVTETPTPDTTAPEDVRNLVLTFKQQLQKFALVMNWDASLDTAKDLADQIVYLSTDLGNTFDTGKSIGATGTDYEISNLEGGKEYTVKLATRDANGNESVGVIKSIRLPQTGFGAGFLVLGSAFIAHRMLKRKRENFEKSM